MNTFTNYTNEKPKGKWIPKEKLDKLFTIVILKAFEDAKILCTLENVLGRTTIKELKNMIYDNTGIAPEFQCLDGGLRDSLLICEIPHTPTIADYNENIFNQMYMRLYLINII